MYIACVSGNSGGVIFHFVSHFVRCRPTLAVIDIVMGVTLHGLRCLMIDFTKAFCYCCRAVLMSNLIGYNVSPPIINWILSFLTGRSEVCKVNGHLSIISVTVAVSTLKCSGRAA